MQSLEEGVPIVLMTHCICENKSPESNMKTEYIELCVIMLLISLKGHF